MEVLHLLLGMSNESAAQDSEGNYYRCLINAKAKQQIAEQVVYLIKLGTYFIFKKDLLKAAKIFNGAYTLICKHRPKSPLAKHILKQLSGIENSYFASYGVLNYLNTEERILGYRQQLKMLRAEANQSLHKEKSIATIQKTLTDGFKEILEAHILAIQKLLGPAPVDWACIGMGSMARGEMCPYSDIEFAFLLETCPEEVQKGAQTYFAT